jgi:glycosyltransferase involved in cell wall biosynthesis
VPGKQPDGQVELLFVGSLSPRKNPLLALRIAEAMSFAHPVRLTYAGTGPLTGLIASQRINAEVHLPGYLTGVELESAWSQADCVLLTSNSDPAPLVLSEAAARGVPFVASDRCGGVTVLQRAGASGRAVRLDADLSVWVDAIVAVINTPTTPVASLLPAPSAARLAEFLVKCATPKP